jgi:hypothetical protein
LVRWRPEQAEKRWAAARGAVAAGARQRSGGRRHMVRWQPEQGRGAVGGGTWWCGGEAALGGSVARWERSGGTRWYGGAVGEERRRSVVQWERSKSAAG